MLIKNISAAEPIRITIGDMEIYVYKIGDASAKIGVKAPKDVHIVIENDDKLKLFK